MILLRTKGGRKGFKCICGQLAAGREKQNEYDHDIEIAYIAVDEAKTPTVTSSMALHFSR